MVALRFYRGALAPGAPLLPVSMLHSNRVHATIKCDYNRVCQHAITSLVTGKISKQYYCTKLTLCPGAVSVKYPNK